MIQSGAELLNSILRVLLAQNVARVAWRFSKQSEGAKKAPKSRFDMITSLEERKLFLTGSPFCAFAFKLLECLNRQATQSTQNEEEFSRLFTDDSAFTKRAENCRLN